MIIRDFNEIEFSDGTENSIKNILYKAYVNGDKIKIKYKQGYEDFTGYHDKTGLIHYCYIGCSTGKRPILLEIFSKRSIGGPGLLTSCIEEVEVIQK